MQELIYHSIYKVSQARGSGSCFYLKDYNLFVTNSHVVEGFRQVALEDHHRNRYPARVILAHPALDVKQNQIFPFCLIYRLQRKKQLSAVKSG